MHVAWRHGARIEAVITLEADVRRSWLRRSRKGLWYCPRDIPRPPPPPVRLRRAGAGGRVREQRNRTGADRMPAPTTREDQTMKNIKATSEMFGGLARLRHLRLEASGVMPHGSAAPVPTLISSSA